MARELPKGFAFDKECIELFKFHLCNFICTKDKVEEFKSMDIDIRLTKSFPLKVKYNKHWYWVAIVKENNKCYWYMRPYNKSYFTTPASEERSFDIVIHAIQEHDKYFRKKKGS